MITGHNFTIVFLSERKGLRSFSISLGELIRRALLIFAVIAVACAGIAYSSHDIQMKLNTLKALQKEKMELFNELETLRPGGEYENYKSVLNNPTVNAVDKKRRGIGGDEFNLELDALSYEPGRDLLSGGDVDLSDDQYLRIIAGVFMKYAELHHQVMSVQNRLDHLPSVLPVKAPILSGFGSRISPFTGRKSFHRGIDLVCETGTPIVAPASGTIIDISVNPLWGLNITIDHGYGIKTQFGHLSKVLKKLGNRVDRWDIIAESGQSGRATGPHLHYQIWLEGEPIDPGLFVMNDERESHM